MTEKNPDLQPEDKLFLYKVERYYRDARLMMIGGGIAEILRFLFQREVFREYFPK